MKPLVSVAVITYNMERYLRPLLDSILKQKVNFPYEIVIDDDHSPDGSREIILEYAKNYPDVIRPRLREQNVGGSRNMYGVMQQCEGKYIAILEGDDFWEDENKLQYQVDFLEAHPEYIGMCCNSWCEHGEVPTYTDKMRNRDEAKVFGFDDFMARSFHDRLPSSTDSWVFRNIFKEYPDEDFSLFYEAHNMIWDQSLILILYGKGKVYADPKLVSHHRSVSKADGTNYQSGRKTASTATAGCIRLWKRISRRSLNVTAVPSISCAATSGSTQSSALCSATARRIGKSSARYEETRRTK